MNQRLAMRKQQLVQELRDLRKQYKIHGGDSETRSATK